MCITIRFSFYVNQQIGPHRQVNARSWDAALDVVQQSLLGMAVANDVNDEEGRVLPEVFRHPHQPNSQPFPEQHTEPLHED
jgi:hypothetical protein